MENNRFQTTFTPSPDRNPRSFVNAGKSSVVGFDKLKSASQSNIFQPLDMHNAPLKLFNSNERPRSNRNTDFEDSSKGQNMIGGLQSSREAYTDPIMHSKAAYSYDLHQQVQEKTLRKRQELERNRDADLNMLKERFENDPFGKQGAGAPIFDEHGRIITTRRKLPFQGPVLPSLGPGRYTSLFADNFDYEQVPVKPYNPHAHIANTSHTLLPEFAMKARLTRDPSLQTLASKDSLNSGKSSQYGTVFSTNSSPGKIYPSSSVNNTHPQHTGYSNLNQYQSQNASLDSLASHPQNSQNQYFVSNTNTNSTAATSTDFTNRTSAPSLQDSLMMFPQAKTINEALEKTRRFQSGVELQNELLAQIEERKRRDEEERRNKKIQDILDEERIRRENEEFNRLQGIKNTKLEHRNLNLSSLNKKGKNSIPNRFYLWQDSSSIDEVERRRRLEDLMLHKAQDSELLTELQKQIKKTVADELKELKLGFSTNQEELNDEVSALKQHSLVAKKDRAGAQKDVDDLKFALQDRQRREDARDKTLYQAMEHKSNLYNMYTNRKFNTDISDEMYALKTEPRHDGFWQKLHQKKVDTEILKARIKSNAELLITTKRENFLNPEQTPDGLISKAKEPLNYLKELDQVNGSGGVMLSNYMGKYNLPDDFDNMKHMVTYSLGGDELDDDDDTTRSLYNNKDRLGLLEQMSNPEVESLDQILAENAKRKYKKSEDNWLNYDAEF